MPSARMVMHRVKWVAFLIVATMGFLHGVERGSNELAAQNVRPPSNATTSKIPGSTRGVGNLPSRSTQQTIVNEGRVPGRSLGNQSDAELWRSLRRGVSGTVSIPDRQAGQLIQSEGELWRSLKNGPITKYGNWAMLASVILIALFFLLRGRIKVDHGMAGSTITRFKDMERVGHWLLAVSFIILAITGLNIAYGKYFMPAIIGKEAFASITQLGKWLHGHVAFAFMLSLVMVLVMWIKHNFPNRHDLIWLFKAGGLFVKNSHPPAKKIQCRSKASLLAHYSWRSFPVTFRDCPDVSVPDIYIRQNLCHAECSWLQLPDGHLTAGGDAACDTLALGYRPCPNLRCHRPYLYWFVRHGGRIRCHGIR